MKLPHRSKRRQQTMFECIRSFLVLHFVLSLYRQLITKSLIHYITQRYLTQSPKVFLQWNKVWLMSLCLKAGYYAMTSPSRLLFNGKSVVNDTVHFIASAASPSQTAPSPPVGWELALVYRGRGSVSTQCVSTSGVRGFSSRRKITP